MPLCKGPFEFLPALIFLSVTFAHHSIFEGNICPSSLFDQPFLADQQNGRKPLIWLSFKKYDQNMFCCWNEAVSIWITNSAMYRLINN